MTTELKNLTGYLNPKFFVRRKSDSELLATIELDECNGDGLLTEYQDVYREHELIDYSGGEENPNVELDNEYLGTRYQWTLNWTDLLQVPNGLNVRDLLNYRIGNENYFIFQPRKDYNFSCEVVKVPSTMELRISKGYELSEGDYGFSFQWRSKYLIQPIYWRDPNAIQVHVLTDIV